MRLALLLLAVVGCSEGKTLLRFHPRSGTYRYTMQQSLKGGLSGGPAGAAVMPVGEAVITGEFREVVEGPRDGGIGVTWRIDTVSVTSATEAVRVRADAAMANNMARVQAMTFEVVYDDRMIPTEAQVTDPLRGAGDELPGTLRNAAHSFAFPLPVEAVGKGDEWRASDEFPLAGVTGAQPLDVQYILTVKDIRVDGSDTTVVIGIATKFPDTPLTMTERGVTLQAKITGTATGQQEFNLTQGALVNGSMDGNIKIEMSAPQLRTPLTMSFELHVSMRRVGGP